MDEGHREDRIASGKKARKELFVRFFPRAPGLVRGRLDPPGSFRAMPSPAFQAPGVSRHSSSPSFGRETGRAPPQGPGPRRPSITKGSRGKIPSCPTAGSFLPDLFPKKSPVGHEGDSPGGNTPLPLGGPPGGNTQGLPGGGTGPEPKPGPPPCGLSSRDVLPWGLGWFQRGAGVEKTPAGPRAGPGDREIKP